MRSQLNALQPIARLKSARACITLWIVTPDVGFSAIGAFSNALILRRPLAKATGLEGW